MVASVVTVLQLVLDPASVTRGLPVPVIAEEVRSIWKPYLDVVMGGPTDAWVPCRQSLHLRITDTPSPGGRQEASALGWIEFVDGEPAPLVTVSVQRARDVLTDALWMGRSVRLLPAAVGTRFVARALGRAIAHEIGRSSCDPRRMCRRAHAGAFHRQRLPGRAHRPLSPDRSGAGAACPGAGGRVSRAAACAPWRGDFTRFGDRDPVPPDLCFLSLLSHLVARATRQGVGDAARATPIGGGLQCSVCAALPGWPSALSADRSMRYTPFGTGIGVASGWGL